MSVNCSALFTRSSFSSYISAVNNATDHNLTLATDCKTEICNALWGSGNPDIDGIGMIVGYILSNALVFLFAVILLAFGLGHQNVRKSRLSTAIVVIRGGLLSSFDSAVFLCFSIQLASIVVMAKLNYGISAESMGDTTARVTWAVSLVTMLPLLYLTFMPELLQKPASGAPSHAIETADAEVDADSATSGKAQATDEVVEAQDLDQEETFYPKQKVHFILFLICWLLSCYPFESKMAGYFTPAQVGNGKTAVISSANWDELTNMCLVGVHRLTDTESKLMEAFSIAGSLFMALMVICWVICQILASRDVYIPLFRPRITTQARKTAFRTMLMVVLPVLAVTQFWTIFRLRGLQREMSKTAGNDDLDNDWTFGQIVAVTVFLPVLVEMWSAWRGGEEEK